MTSSPSSDLHITDTGELAAQLRIAVARLARQLRHHAGAGLTPSQHSALAAVDVYGPLRLGHLAKLERVAPPTITRIIDRLEQDDLVRRTMETEDRRHSRVEITDSGRLRMEESRSRRNAWLAERLATLSAAELQSISAALPALDTLALIDDADGTRR